MKHKHLALLVLATIPLLARGEGFTVDTVTRNDWKTVDTISLGETLAKNGGTITENSATNIKYEYKYADGTILGTKTKYMKHGDTVNEIITNRNVTVSNDIRTKPTTETTIASEGTIHFIHVDDGTSIDWQDGVHVYNSNNKLVDRSETILNFDTKTNFNVTTHKRYHGHYYNMFNVIKVVGEGSTGDVTKPVSTVNFLKKVTMDTRVQTINPGNLTYYEKRVNGFFLQPNQGGESHVHFHDDLTMHTESTTNNLEVAAFRLENDGENRYRTVSTKDTIEAEKGGSSLTFDGNVTSHISGNTDTAMRFLSNVNYHGGVHVASKEGKNFISTITNESVDNTQYILNVNTDTKNHGFSEFNLKANTDFITKSTGRVVWGMYINADSHGENRITLAGAKNNISTTGKDAVYGIDVNSSLSDTTDASDSNEKRSKNLVDLQNTTVTTDSTSAGNPWVYGVKMSAINGENTVKLTHSDVNTASNFAARSIDMRDENRGTNTVTLDTTNITTKGNYAYGVNLMSSDKTGGGSNSIHWKGKNGIVTEAITNGYGIRIEKDKSNSGAGTTITSDADSSLAIKVDTEKSGTGISQVHSNPDNKTNSTFNGDVSIMMRGNGIYKTAVFAGTEGVGTNDTSSNTITFNKKLNIDGNPTDPALVATGRHANITVSGKDTTTIVGNVFAGNSGTVDVNLLTKDSYLIGMANNNSSGTINVKAHNGNYWEMTDNSNINQLDLSNSGEVRFGDTEVPLSLTADTLAGTGGVLHMASNVGSGDTDKLIIRSSSEGKHGIYFQNMADSKSTGTEVLQLVESLGTPENHKAVFSLQNEGNHVAVPTDDKKPSRPKAVIEKGAYLYTLGRPTDSKVVSINDANVNNWYLFPYEDDGKGKLTPGAHSTIQFDNLLYNLHLGNIETLVQRLGEIHLQKDVERSNTVWANYTNGKFDSSYHGGYQQRYWGLKGGYNWIHPRDTWIHYSGFTVGMMQSTATLNEYQGHAKLSGTELGFYSTQLYKDTNVYVDLVGKLRRSRGEFDLVNYSNEALRSTTMHANSFLASVELGKRMYRSGKDGEGLFIQPEAQLTYEASKGYSVDISNGLHSQLGAMHSLIGRIGVRAGVNNASGTAWNPYVKVMYEKEFLGNRTLTFNESTTEQLSYKGHWFTYGLGFSYMNRAKTEHVYLEAQRSTRDRVQQNWQLKVGVRHTF